MSNSSSLQQLSLQFDSHVKNANTSFYRLDLDANISRYLLQDSRGALSMEASYKTHQILRTMKSANFSDFLLYYTNSDRVVSSVNASLNMEMYYNVYYRANNLTFSKFRNCFDGLNISTVKSIGGIYDIAIFHSLPSNNLKNPNAVAMYKPNRSSILEMLNSAQYSSDSL
ncbi:MAG: hypothetical protein GX974_04655, partial [Clostridiales bacterium]|nr:hypothetical protein [Clostridiales bacterium]